MASTKDEITAIAIEHGYTGKKPDSIAKAIDALADTLAGEDVSSGRSIDGAIHALAPYIGSGGGGGATFGQPVQIYKSWDSGGFRLYTIALATSPEAIDLDNDSAGDLGMFGGALTGNNEALVGLESIYAAQGMTVALIADGYAFTQEGFPITITYYDEAEQMEKSVPFTGWQLMDEQGGNYRMLVLTLPKTDYYYYLSFEDTD